MSDCRIMVGARIGYQPERISYAPLSGLDRERAREHRDSLVELAVLEVDQPEPRQRSRMLRVDLYGSRVSARGLRRVLALLVDHADLVHGLGVGRVAIRRVD